MMRINKREKNLIIGLLLLLCIYGYYNFILKNQWSKIETLEKKSAEIKVKVENTKKEIGTYAAKEAEFKVVNSKIIAKAERLLPTIMQEKIIVTLDEMLSKTTLDGSSIAFSENVNNGNKEENIETTLKNAPKETKIQQAARANGASGSSTNKDNDSKATNQSTLNKEELIVNISYKGTYGSILDFIQTLEGYSKKVIISSITLAAGKDTEMSGAVTLEFYAIPGLSNEDKEYLKWDYKNKYGKDNPFTGESIAMTIPNSSEKKEVQYDFIMTSKPVSSDLPATILGKAKDAARSSYVYGDSAETEPVEVYFTQEDGKYFYKWKTSRDIYPKAFEGNGMEFTPFGSSLYFKIYATKRNAPLDVAGAAVKIFNKTDKTVMVDIEGDDKERPRVQILGQNGEVAVKRE